LTVRNFLDQRSSVLKIVFMDTKRRARIAGLRVSEALAPYAVMSAAPDAQDLDVEGLLMQQIGARLREARGLRPRGEMADLLAVHENTIGKLERGESVPDAIQLLLYAQHTGRPLLWLPRVRWSLAIRSSCRCSR
jgi:hypothetical protein